VIHRLSLAGSGVFAESCK